eukprot:s1885_g2.t1
MARLVLTDGTKKLSQEVTECANCKSYLYQGEETLRRRVKLEKIGPVDYRLPEVADNLSQSASSPLAQTAGPSRISIEHDNADLRERAQVEQKLKAAMDAQDLVLLSAAISEAQYVGVSQELLLDAREVKVALMEAATNSPSRSSASAATLQRLLQVSSSGMDALGVRICQACDMIFQYLQEPEQGNPDDALQQCCREARKQGAPDVLQNSIFGLMQPEDIKDFLQSPDHRLWFKIKQNTEHFVELLQQPGAAVGPTVKDMTPEAKNDRIGTMRPVVMDQSIREPATNTPFGHTGYQKYLTLQIVRAMGFKDIAISGQYYAGSYTPETQILEWMKSKGEDMAGMIVMFAPGKEDRDAGLRAIREYGIPNAFLDLTMKSSVRFKETNFVSSVLETVQRLDELFTGMGLDEKPWRTEEEVNNKPGRGEISLNLVDLMEFLDLKPDGTMNKQKVAEAESAFSTWKSSDAFRRRVVGILTEEGRGMANHDDYGTLVKWLRQFFPEGEQFRILVHAHAGYGNTQDAASIQAALQGANGVWAALIPQAAQAGHNSSLVFLDNMLQMGNAHVLEDFWLHQAAQCARHMYYLNFNTYNIPDDCPIWGGRVDQLLHTAFNTVSGEVWRQRRGMYYNVWGSDERAQIDRMARATPLQQQVASLRSNARGGNYRISPLVSDIETWTSRLVELGGGVVGPRERAGDHVHEVRALGFALMNAGIRANMNEESTLKKLWNIAKRNKTNKTRCEKVAGYLKARQHQGEKE